MLRETIIQERVIRREEIEDIPILMNDAAEEKLNLAAKRLPQVVIEVRKQWNCRIQIGRASCRERV